MIFENQRKINLKTSQLSIHRFYAVNYPFYEMSLHAHSEWEIMYVVHGKCLITCLIEGKKEIFKLKGGEYILIGSDVTHALHVEKHSPCRILNLEGRLELADETGCIHLLKSDESFQSFLADSKNVLCGNDDGRLHDTLKSLIYELRESKSFPQTENNPMIQLLLGQFILLIARQRTHEIKNECGRTIYNRKAHLYIEEHFDQEITITDIAKAVNISEGYLQRIYKKEKGCCITEAILRLRIEKAKLLLNYSTLPIIDIAINVGFNNRQHFSTMFHKYTGCSPMQWRKNNGIPATYKGFSCDGQ